MEQQRKGRNRKTIVNLAYINSGEYKRKFDNIAAVSYTHLRAHET